MSPWERKLALIRGALAPVGVLVGRWEGEGIAHGEPVCSILEIRFAFSGTFIEVREKTGEHEDLCFYRFEPGIGYSAIHLMEGSFREVAVELLPTGGLEWVTGPMEASVIWEVVGETLVQEVIWPEGEGPEVRVVYRRADNAR
jgi:hypothetical protein